jgi:hypothetical protein
LSVSGHALEDEVVDLAASDFDGAPASRLEASPREDPARCVPINHGARYRRAKRIGACRL